MAELTTSLNIYLRFFAARNHGHLDPAGDERTWVSRFVNVFVGQEDIRFLSGLDTTVEDGVEVSIIPAIAGGAEHPRDKDGRKLSRLV